MSVSEKQKMAALVSAFNRIARHKHRYEVFRDFVTMSAITIHNAVNKDEKLEAEYLQIAGKYPRDELFLFCELFGSFVLLLDAEPRDVLGELYMSLDLGNAGTGQYFTPSDVSELMAQISYGESLRTLTTPFVTVCEPACGAGGMMLAFAKIMIANGHDPAKTMWVQCQDIDRLAALMCYIQLSLWNIPAMVSVGNTLTMERREVFYTPQHYLGKWSAKLQNRVMQEAEDGLLDSMQSADRRETFESKNTYSANSAESILNSETLMFTRDGDAQFDFGF